MPTASVTATGDASVMLRVAARVVIVLMSCMVLLLRVVGVVFGVEVMVLA